MNTKIRQKLARSKRRLARRLDKADLRGCDKPMITASNIHYEIGERDHGIAYGGIGSIQQLVQKLGLTEAIDRRLQLLKIHMPYHESDHVYNIAFNPLCDGTCLEDIELRRNDEAFLDALGARRIPDPTTAGDFCRRFTTETIQTLLDIFDETRLQAWRGQPTEFFAEAVIDMDGHLVATTGECKQGMDIAYDGTWGYHPLLVSLANTGEVLSIVNRSGNRPSHEGAAEYVNRAIQVCLRGGFRRLLLRGDTDFSQTEHLDGWAKDPRIRFIFGYDAKPNLEEIADNLPQSAWTRLERPPRYTVQTQPRERPANIKEQIVRQRAFENQRLQAEAVAEFDYRPAACHTTYRMIVLRKTITVEKGTQLLFPKTVYFYYITNDWEKTPAAVVFLANDRCNQENLIAQLSSGVRALRAPVNNLESNWAYMVMTSLAWNLKAWWALRLPERPGRYQEQHRDEKQAVLKMEFKTFVNAFVRLPCQIVRSGRRLIYRLLSWNPWQPVFFRLVEALRC